ncbi:MAG: ribosome silencing factor [Christensenellales bacterium]|nr:ribosome silencing factor [Christensenellales bacterium]
MDTRALALKVAEILDLKGALEISVLSVEHLTSITDYFVVASGRNVQSVRSLAEDLEEKLAEMDVMPRRKDGMHDSRWIVLDYNSVIVHIFHPEEREYYNIERLWQDGTNQVEFVSVEEK